MSCGQYRPQCPMPRQGRHTEVWSDLGPAETGGGSAFLGVVFDAGVAPPLYFLCDQELNHLPADPVIDQIGC
jgi:hypothetical protein